MPRLARKYSETSYFHIMVQGLKKEYIFDKYEDIKYYISLMYRLKAEYSLKIIAYCIMNNHAHFLIHVDNITELSKYMQRLNIIYGRYYNKKYNRVGFVFRNRFQSEGIYNEQQLYCCIRYIYNNPIEAGVCDRVEDYPYSNYKYLKTKENIENETNLEYNFLDNIEDADLKLENIISEYLKKNKTNIKLIKKDKEKLIELIKYLNVENKISSRKIAQKLEIGRETIRKIVKVVRGDVIK